MEKIQIPFLYFCVQHPAYWVDHWLQEPKVSIHRDCFAFWSFVWLEDGLTFLFSFDGIVLVTQSHDTLPAELESLKAPLQDYSSVSQLPVKYTNSLFFIPSTIFVMALSQNCTGRDLISWYTWFCLFLGGQRAGRGCGGLEGPRSPWKPPHLCLHWPCKPWLWRYQTF